LLDRIDIHVEVPAVRWRELTQVADGERSATIRKRINAARKIQLARLEKASIFCNAQMSARHLKKFCILDRESMAFLEKAVETLGLSARAYHRILKIARTIADMEASADIKPPHVAEAIQYRTLDRRPG
jgi:magnesium chelatase family protein